MSAWLLLFLRFLLTVLLYIFVGWAVITLWWDLRRLAETVRIHPSEAAIKLLVETENGIKTFQFNKATVTIGRDPGCDFSLDDKTVSNRHTRLSFHHSQWWVEDLRSKNGTFLNGERVETPTVIITGDELRCGKIDFAGPIS